MAALLATDLPIRNLWKAQRNAIQPRALAPAEVDARTFRAYLDQMNLKPAEIALLVLAIVVPVVILGLAFTPGGLNWVFELVLDRVYGPIVFFGGAAILTVVLMWRIYRRLRPAQKKPAEKPIHVSPRHMPKVEGSAAVERLKNRKPGV